MAGTTRLRVAGAGVLAAAFGYSLADAANEALAFSKCQRLAMGVLKDHPKVVDFVCRGEGDCDVKAGPWYDSSMKLVLKGRMAIATFRIDGTSASSEVWVRASRPPAWRSTLLYNTLGPGEWELIGLEATLKTEGGMAKRVSLLEDCKDCSKDESAPKGGGGSGSIGMASSSGS